MIHSEVEAQGQTQSHDLVWQCPVCQTGLQKQRGQWRCSQGHCYDIAKEGYTHLLLANQKKSADPGDSKVMLRHRRDFLQAGYYEPLAQCIAILLQQFAPQKDRLCLLDNGCGEGYYSHYLATQLPSLQVRGVDIAKEGVRLASRHFAVLNTSVAPTSPDKGTSWRGEFAVASCFQLPLMSASVDAILRVFAPASAQEMRRVLSADGCIIAVYPGTQHLSELRHSIYAEVLPHEPPPALVGFTMVHEETLSWNLELPSSESIEQLLSMTPFFWRASDAVKQQLLAQSQWQVTVDFSVCVYRPHADTGNGRSDSSSASGHIS